LTMPLFGAPSGYHPRGVPRCDPPLIGMLPDFWGLHATPAHDILPLILTG